ncbi:hypothetical protein GQ457_13G022110 [Hibiscus cannabinus]
MKSTQGKSLGKLDGGWDNPVSVEIENIVKYQDVEKGEIRTISSDPNPKSGWCLAEIELLKDSFRILKPRRTHLSESIKCYVQGFYYSSVVQGSMLTSLVELDLSCSSLIRDYSSAYYSLSSNLTTHSGYSYSYINGGRLYASNLNWLQGLKNLKKLKLSGVNLSEVSQSTLWAKPISNLTNQRFLDLLNCRISGEIPKLLLGNNSDLMVDLHSMFAVPWPRLEWIDISSTRVIGSIPPSIDNITSLVTFMAYDSFIQGHKPFEVRKLVPRHEQHEWIEKVRALDLSANNFTGSIPAEVGQGNIRYLALSDNEPSGRIPFSLCQEKSELLLLDLSNNNLLGTIPTSFRNCTETSLNSLETSRTSGFFGWNSTYSKSTVWSEVIQTEDNHKPTNRWRSCTVSQLYVGVEVNTVAKGLYLQFDVVRTYNNGMDLSCNNLNGNIPSELGLLQGLYAFNLSHIPSET